MAASVSRKRSTNIKMNAMWVCRVGSRKSSVPHFVEQHFSWNKAHLKSLDHKKAALPVADIDKQSGFRESLVCLFVLPSVDNGKHFVAANNVSRQILDGDRANRTLEARGSTPLSSTSNCPCFSSEVRAFLFWRLGRFWGDL